MNTLVKTTTGVSPTELIFGSSVNHDDHFLKTPKSTTSNESHHEHIKSLVEAQERTIKIAQENQEDHGIYVIAEKSKDHSHMTHFPINSCVRISTIRNTRHKRVRNYTQ